MPKNIFFKYPTPKSSIPAFCRKLSIKKQAHISTVVCRVSIGERRRAALSLINPNPNAARENFLIFYFKMWFAVLTFSPSPCWIVKSLSLPFQAKISGPSICCLVQNPSVGPLCVEIRPMTKNIIFCQPHFLLQSLLIISPLRYFLKCMVFCIWQGMMYLFRILHFRHLAVRAKFF